MNLTAEQLRDRFPKASEAFIRANSTGAGVRVAVATPAGQQKAANATQRNRYRLRQSKKGLNKTEQAWVDHLRATLPDYRHYAQCITLLLANGCRYTPDTMSVCNLTGKWSACEVKGHMRDDAAVKLKVAATFYPHITFRLVTRTKSGDWETQYILP